MGIRADSVSLTDAADAALARLERSKDARSRSIAKRVRAYRAILLADALHGEVVRKPLPRALVVEHGVTNLYVEDLPDFWRLIYTIVRIGAERHIVVIEIVDHAAYDEWFPGTRR